MQPRRFLAVISLLFVFGVLPLAARADMPAFLVADAPVVGLPHITVPGIAYGPVKTAVGTGDTPTLRIVLHSIFDTSSTSVSADLSSLGLSTLSLPAPIASPNPSHYYLNYTDYYPAYSYDFGPLTIPAGVSDGRKAIPITTSDVYGNSAASTTYLTIDTAPPTIALSSITFSTTSPAAGDYMYLSGRVDGTGSSATVYEVSEFLYDADGNPLAGTYPVPGDFYGEAEGYDALPVQTTLVSSGNGTFTNVPVQLIEGDPGQIERAATFRIRISAYDEAGNYASSTLSVPVPHPAPAPTTCAPSATCVSNVLFLPGIEASRLYDSTEKLWEPGGDSDMEQLYLDAAGKSVRNDIKATDVIDKTAPIIGTNIYKSFLADLAAASSTGIMKSYAAIPYDWRLSIPDILADGTIAQKVRNLAASSKTGKVTIVAHSNGGLIAKALINALGPDASSLVDNLVLVGVPQLGTPEAIGALLHGYDTGLPFNWLPFVVTNARARDFARNAPMTYQLLPHHDYFSSPGATIATPLATFVPGTSTAPFIAAYGQTIDTTDELNRFVLGQEGRQAPTYGDLYNPTIGNGTLLSQATQYLAPIDAGWQAPAGIHVHEIAGVGEDTLTSVTYRDGPVACAQWRSATYSTPQCLRYYNGLIYDPKTALDGDGTVVTPSALAMSTSTEQVTRWWVNLDTYNLTKLGTLLDKIGIFHTKHADLFEISDIRHLILNQILASSTPSYAYITSTAPIIAAKDRLSFTLHSPLDLWVTDAAGNKVSSSTIAIPGASYARYGEVQVISVPKDVPVTLHMQGEETGIFTLDLADYSGDSVTATTSFVGVPTTSTTQVTMPFSDNSIQNAGALSIDYQGDSTPDLILQPKLDSAVSPDITPPVTTIALSGTQGAHEWYTSNVQASLTATDTQSGVRNTFFSLDSGAVTAGTSTSVTAEGAHKVSFYSVDNAGNQEATTTIAIKLDKTAPEAVLSASSTSKDLLVISVDNLSSTTMSVTTATTTVTDDAGHTLKIAFQKTYSGKYLSYAKIKSIQYDAAAPIQLPSSFTYLWDSTGTLLSQTVIVDSQFIVQALYDKTKNKTTIIVLKRNAPIQSVAVTGLAVVRLMTSKGQVSYGW